jgi:ANTAR domain
MDVIRVHAPSEAHGRRLVEAVGGRFSASMDGGRPESIVELRLDEETASKLVELFNALGQWLTDGELTACPVGFGDRTYTLLAATAAGPNDPAQFLLERTIQLQIALDSRIVIEQAKGIVAERDGIGIDEAFERLRVEARSRRMRIHDLAAGIVATVGSRADGSPA